MFSGNECTSVHAPYELSVHTAILTSLLCIITFPSNTLVISVILKDPLKRLRSPFYMFVVSLSLADLSVGLLAEPVLVYYMRAEALWLDSLNTSLTIFHVLFFASSTASVLSILALTVDRYLAASSPLNYKSRVNSKRSLKICIAILVVSLASSTLYFKVKFVLFCFIFVNFAVVSTFVFIVFTYIKVYNILWHQARLLSGYQGEDQNIRQEASIRKRDEKVTKALLAMLFAFLLCNGPSCVIIYIMNLCEGCSCYVIHWLRDYSIILILLNSAINPFLYTIRLPFFKQSIKLVMGLKTNIVRDVSVSNSFTNARRNMDETSGRDGHGLNN